MNEQTQKIQTWLKTGSLNFFGLPFAGKDTQARHIADLFNGVMISGGDILRHSSGHPRVQQIMAEGGIIPSDLFEEIVIPYLMKPELDGRPLILSEVGRVEEEAHIIMKATADANHPIVAAILLSMPSEEVWKRFDASRLEHDRGERADDKREVLQTRLDQFEAKVIPVIDLYRSQNLLIEVDGTLSREEVFSQIINGLADRAAKIN